MFTCLPLYYGNISCRPLTMGSHGEADVTLSFKGWEHYENLREGTGKYRKAFMAMKYEEIALDQVFNDVLKPSVAQTGFDLVRLDELPHAGLIDNRMRVEIQNSDFLIADLTHANPGAYWEAGYAEGLGKPVIYTCKKEIFDAEKTHFDTNHHLTVLWDESDSDSSTTGEQLKATIRATLPHLAKMND
jgi:nucleoside 2-deoxyribosyltransferase